MKCERRKETLEREFLILLSKAETFSIAVVSCCAGWLAGWLLCLTATTAVTVIMFASAAPIAAAEARQLVISS